VEPKKVKLMGDSKMMVMEGSEEGERRKKGLIRQTEHSLR
jgi:hypothetical protein